MLNAESITEAKLADLDELTLLFDEYRQFQGRPSDPDAARVFLKARIEHGESVLFIARNNSQPTGIAQLYRSFSSVSLARVYILNDLFVRPNARRRGIASALLSAVERYAWSLGAARLTLNVASENAAARQLYTDFGWEEDSRFVMLHRFPS